MCCRRSVSRVRPDYPPTGPHKPSGTLGMRCVELRGKRHAGSGWQAGRMGLIGQGWMRCGEVESGRAGEGKSRPSWAGGHTCHLNLTCFRHRLGIHRNRYS